jgi:hypothetical protein
MSSELQIQSSILCSIVAHAVEAKLQAACFDSIAIDHIHLAAAPAATAPTNAAVRLQVPLEVSFARTRTVPAKADGASIAAEKRRSSAIMAILELAATGAIVAVRCIDVDVRSLEDFPGESRTAIKDALISAIGTPFTSDLSSAFKQLGAPIPRFSRVDLVAGIVAVRFEPAGAAAARLPAGQEWGLFLDGSAVEKLARSKLPTDFTSHITSLVIDARWRPSNTIPHVDLDYSCKAPQVGEPVVGDVSGTIGCDFSLTATEARRLRSTVRWSLDIKLGALVPKFVTDIVKDAITGFMNPVRFGGIPLDDHSFVLESELPDIIFGGAHLEQSSLIATSAGMTFGGSVEMPPRGDGKSLHHRDFPAASDACTCAASEKSGRCNRCRTRIGNKSPSEPAKLQRDLSIEKTRWEREILAKVLGSLRKAETWASSTLPCRDFIALPSRHPQPAVSSRDNSRSAMTSL